MFLTWFVPHVEKNYQDIERNMETNDLADCEQNLLLKLVVIVEGNENYNVHFESFPFEVNI